MFTESPLKMLPILTSDSHDDVSEEQSCPDDSRESEADGAGVDT